MSKKNYGLVTGGGVFFDDETGLKVLPNKPVSIDKNAAGAKTNQAILSGGLVEISEASGKTSKKNEDVEKQVQSDLPENFPGREAFIENKMNLEQIKTFDFEKDKVPGVGAKTIEAVKAYFKQ